VPHLTKDMLSRITDLPAVTQMSLNLLYLSSIMSTPSIVDRSAPAGCPAARPRSLLCWSGASCSGSVSRISVAMATMHSPHFHRNTTHVYRSLQQETQLSLTNRATHLCSAMEWLTAPKTRSSPCVTPPNLAILRHWV